MRYGWRNIVRFIIWTFISWMQTGRHISLRYIKWSLVIAEVSVMTLLNIVCWFVQRINVIFMFCIFQLLQIIVLYFQFIWLIWIMLIQKTLWPKNYTIKLLEQNGLGRIWILYVIEFNIHCLTIWSILLILGVSAEW